jgi:hypothetical protein
MRLQMIQLLFIRLKYNSVYFEDSTEKLVKKVCPKCGKKERFNKITGIRFLLSRGFRRGI